MAKKTLKQMDLEELRMENGQRLLILLQVIDHIEVAKDNELKDCAAQARESHEEFTRRFNAPY